MPHQSRAEGGPESEATLGLKMMTAVPGEAASEMMQGAGPMGEGASAEVPASEKSSGEEPSGEKDVTEGLSGRAKDLAEAYLEVRDQHGLWPKPASGYEPRSMRGQKCKGCVFYEAASGGGAGGCKLVEGPVQPEGVCNLFVSSNES